jgi:hypothetical protein
MEQEIHFVLVELFKRYASKRKYFLHKYFASDEYAYSDIEQEFYLKLFDSLMKDQQNLHKLQDSAYFAQSLKYFIIDNLRKNRIAQRTLSIEADELLDNVLSRQQIEEEHQQTALYLNLTTLINACHFEELDKKLLFEHYLNNVAFVVLNEIYSHSNTQQKTARLIKRLQRELTKVQNENEDKEIILINDLQ